MLAAIRPRVAAVVATLGALTVVREVLIRRNERRLSPR